MRPEFKESFASQGKRCNNKKENPHIRRYLDPSKHFSSFRSPEWSISPFCFAWRPVPASIGLWLIRQLGDLPNMIQPPLLGVVNAASAVLPEP